MISLNPSSFVSGGLLNDVDVEVVEARYSLFDYQGTVDPVNARTTLRLKMRTLDGQQDATEHLTLGQTQDFIPNEADGGLTLRSLSGKSGLSKKSKLFFFLQSLVEAGFDASHLDSGRADCLEGVRFHFVRKPMPDLSGLEITRRGKNPDQQVEYIHVTKYLGEAAKAKAKPKAAAEAEGDFDAEVQAAALEILSQVGKPGMTLSKLGIEALRQPKLSPKLRQAVSKLLSNPQWLEEVGCVLEGNVLRDSPAAF